MKEYLNKLLEDCESLPFLFVGSGISKRYLGLPNWEELLKMLSQKTYNQEFKYSQNMNKIRSRYHIDPRDNYNDFMCKMCDLIEEDLNTTWFEEDRFLESRNQYKDAIEKGVPPLKIEIANIILESAIQNEKMLEEINTLKEISYRSISGIITTNYDTFLEDIFDFVTYSSQDDLIFNSNYEIGEIYKIHGTVDNPNTIMINTDDYKKIEQKNKYLAAKLLTIFVEHPVIFLGYSIGDEDIQALLSSIVECLDAEKLKILQKRLIFVEWDKEEEAFTTETATINFGNGKGTIAMQKISLNNYSILYDALSHRVSKYPVSTLRTLKKDMYKLVLKNDPDSKLLVAEPDKLTDYSDKIEYYAGFGIIDVAKRGYRSIKAEELFEDILFDNGDFDPELMIEDTIPSLNKMFKPLPQFKYYSKFQDKELSDELSSMNYDTFLNSSLKKMNINEKSLTEIIEKQVYTLSKKFSLIAILGENNINVEQLNEYLCAVWRENPGIIKHPNQNTKTNYKRLIRLFDWLKYAKK